MTTVRTTQKKTTRRSLIMYLRSLSDIIRNRKLDKEGENMEYKMVVSLLIGYIAALLPIWNWEGKLELFTGTIVLSVMSLIALIWIQEKKKAIKKALTSANVRATKKTTFIDSIKNMKRNVKEEHILHIFREQKCSLFV